MMIAGDTNPMSGGPVAMPPPPPGSSFYDCAKYFVSAVGNNEENSYKECDEASKRKMFTAVKEALEAGGDINEGEGVLLYAVEECAVILVAGSDPARTVGSFNQNLLNFVKYLIDKGADVNRKGAEQWTPEFFKSELEVYGGVNGNTPLLAAMQHPCPDIVEMLLDAGASTRTKNFMGNTPLMVACGGVGNEIFKEANLEVIHMLLGRLESGNAEDRASLTGALICLCDSVCGLVSETESIELVTIMLEKGADVNGSIAGIANCGADMKIRTAISGAARNGYLLLMRFLVKNGADPSTVYPSVSSKLTVSELALITVCRFGCGDPATSKDGSEIPAIISQLIEYGANPNNCRSEKGSTDLFFEMDGGATLLIRLTSSWAETAFPHSLPAMVTVLVEAGADINATDFMGCTLLHQPDITTRSLDMILKASSRPLDLEVVNESGNTPLMTAKNCYNRAMIQWLRDAGAEETALERYCTDTFSRRPCIEEEEGIFCMCFAFPACYFDEDKNHIQCCGAQCC